MVFQPPAFHRSVSSWIICGGFLLSSSIFSCVALHISIFSDFLETDSAGQEIEGSPLVSRRSLL